MGTCQCVVGEVTAGGGNIALVWQIGDKEKGFDRGQCWRAVLGRWCRFMCTVWGQD